MADDVIGVQNIGNKVIVENVGAKRVTGIQLIAQAKIANWMFFITDIDSMAVYANQGTDVWIGAFGQVVAGSTTLRLGLSPFEGQKFYDLDLNTAFTFTGGAWNGGAIKSNLLSPTVITAVGSVVLTRGRAHYLDNDTIAREAFLPSSTDPLEDTLDGHMIEIYVTNNTTLTTLTSPGVEVFRDNNTGNVVSSLLLQEGCLYTIVFEAGRWEVFFIDPLNLVAIIDTKLSKAANLSDVVSTSTSRTNLGVRSSSDQDIIDNAQDSNLTIGLGTKLTIANDLSDVASVSTSRTNLGVRSSADQDTIDGVQDTSLTVGLATKLNVTTTIDNLTGIVKSGTLAANTLGFGADFATDAEAADPSNAVKVIAPKNIASAVSSATRSSEFNNITGLLPKETEVKYLMVVDVGDANKMNFPEFSVVFNADPYLRTEDLVLITIPAGQLALPNSGGLPTSHFIKVNNSGIISLTLSKPAQDSVTEIFLGVVLEINGEVVTINNGPWLSSSDSTTRLASDSINGGIVSASATVGKVKQDASNFFRESVNWEQSTISPHINVITAKDPLTITYVDRFGVIIGPTFGDEVDGDELDDATNVGNNNYSIQLAFTSSEGGIVILKGQEIFTNLTDVLAAVESYAPIIPLVLNTTLEYSRWIVRGNQFPGSGSLDLTNSSNFQTAIGKSVSGAAVGNNAVNILTSNISNTLSDTNLQLNIDELDAKIVTVTGNGNFSKLDNPMVSLFQKNLMVERLAGVGTFTRASIATFLDRYDVVQTAANDVAREEAQGWFNEVTITNHLLHSRNLADVAWTKVGVTTTQTVAGHDGGATTATVCTATAPNATIQQTVTLVSAEYTFSADIKRILGTGVVEITMDGGSTYTDITSQLVLNKYIRVQLTTTILDPTVGIRIVTSADEIHMDYTQLELFSRASSRIETTTVAVVRAADVFSIVTRDNYIGSFEGTSTQVMRIEFVGKSGIGPTIVQADAGGPPNSYRVRLNTTDDTIKASSSSPTELTSASLDITKPIHIVVVRGSGIEDSFLYIDGVLVDQISLNQSFALNVSGDVNFHVTGINAYITDYRFYDYGLDATEVRSLADTP